MSFKFSKRSLDNLKGVDPLLVLLVTKALDVLQQDTTYIFEITSKDDDNVISYCGEWYEHTNKN